MIQAPLHSSPNKPDPDRAAALLEYLFGVCAQMERDGLVVWLPEGRAVIAAYTGDLSAPACVIAGKYEHAQADLEVEPAPIDLAHL